MSQQLRRILASDIDGTLLRDGQTTPGLETLKILVENAAMDIKLVYVTGRSFRETLAPIEAGVLPQPDAIGAMVGTELWLPPWQGPDDTYGHELSGGWDRDAVAEATRHHPAVSAQPDRYQTPLKLSYYCEDPEIEDTLTRRLTEQGLSARIIWSAGKHLDLLPARAGKRRAVDYIRRRWGVPRHRVLFCGDSGNDLTVLEDPRYLGVAVGNSEEELEHLTEGHQVHQASLPYAAGVLEGAEEFGFWEATNPSLRTPREPASSAGKADRETAPQAGDGMVGKSAQ